MYSTQYNSLGLTETPRRISGRGADSAPLKTNENDANMHAFAVFVSATFAYLLERVALAFDGLFLVLYKMTTPIHGYLNYKL